jgi:tellurium resistance protein TerD
MINLDKGGRINLTKAAPTMTRARIGLAWRPNDFSSGFPYDLDVTAFVLKQDGTTGKVSMLSEQYMIFYGNLNAPDGSVIHTGDNRTGDREGDDEELLVELAKLPAMADEVSFIVTIYEAPERKQNFGQIPGCSIRIYNDETNEIIAKYDLEEDFSSETAVQFGSLYKKEGQWGFKAVGQGFNVGLAEFVTGYGGQVA